LLEFWEKLLEKDDGKSKNFVKLLNQPRQQEILGRWLFLGLIDRVSPFFSPFVLFLL